MGGEAAKRRRAESREHLQQQGQTAGKPAALKSAVKRLRHGDGAEWIRCGYCETTHVACCSYVGPKDPDASTRHPNGDRKWVSCPLCGGPHAKLCEWRESDESDESDESGESCESGSDGCRECGEDECQECGAVCYGGDTLCTDCADPRFCPSCDMDLELKCTDCDTRLCASLCNGLSIDEGTGALCMDCAVNTGMLCAECQELEGYCQCEGL